MGIGQYLLANNMRASLVALVLMLLPAPLNLLAPIVVAFITLQKGLIKGLLLLSWVVLPVVAATWKAPNLALAYDVPFVICLFCWGFAILLRWTRTWMSVLELVSALGALIVLVIMILVPQAVLNSVAAFLGQIVLDNLKQTMSLDMGPLQDFVHRITPYLVGSLYTVIALTALIALMLARVWQLKIIAAGEKRIEFYGIRARRIYTLIAAVIIITAMIWHFEWLVALAQVVTLPLIFAGLSVLIYVNGMQERHRYLNLILLLVGVIAVLFLLGFLPIVLALIGFVDSWINFRKLHVLRIKRANP